jgi:hypothetical protein
MISSTFGGGLPPRAVQTIELGWFSTRCATARPVDSVSAAAACGSLWMDDEEDDDDDGSEYIVGSSPDDVDKVARW